MNTSGLRSLPACIKKEVLTSMGPIDSFTFLVSHLIPFDPRSKINGAKKTCEAKKETHIRSSLLNQLGFPSRIPCIAITNSHIYI